MFDAIRRGYGDLTQADDGEIEAYFENVDTDSLPGHIGNIKGILFEEEYVEKLRSEGIDAVLFRETNHPASDVMIYGDNGEIIDELQLKATESSAYIEETLEGAGDEVTVVATTEVAQQFSEEVVDSGISEALLEEVVSDAIVPISPISLIGALFGVWL